MVQSGVFVMWKGEKSVVLSSRFQDTPCIRLRERNAVLILFNALYVNDDFPLEVSKSGLRATFKSFPRIIIPLANT